MSIGTLLASSLFVVASLDADTVTCKDGRVVHGEITRETENEVTIGIYGAQVVIPRAQISSIARTTAEGNRLLEKKYEQLEERYKEESSKAAQRDADNDQAESMPPPEPPPDDDDSGDDDSGEDDSAEPEAIVFPAYPSSEAAPSSDGAAQAGSPNRVEERLSWERDVRQAVYQKRVIPGMTERQVQSAWGFPDLIHPVHGIYNYTDRWIYDREDVGKVSVYFNNGVVVSVYQ